MDKYRIINYRNGKYGYKNYFELQQWNIVFEHYYVIKYALALEFIRNYCLYLARPKIDFDAIKIVEE